MSLTVKELIASMRYMYYHKRLSTALWSCRKCAVEEADAYVDLDLIGAAADRLQAYSGLVIVRQFQAKKSILNL